MFERIAHTSPEVIYVFDLDARRNTYVNRDAVAQLGYSRAEIGDLGNEILPRILHPEDLPHVMSHFAEFAHMSDDERTEITYRVKDTSNVYRWFRARENVFSRHPDGRSKEILGVAADITALKQTETRLALLATTDELTGLANHRSFRERLGVLLHEAGRGRAFVLCLVDVDHFKRINDPHGHPVGDRALAAVAQALSDNVRKVDQVARYGGEEFSILLVDTNEDNALMLAERLRHAVASLIYPLPVTASFGVAAFESGLNAATLLERADNALYRAKRQGRNRVVSSSRRGYEHLRRRRARGGCLATPSL